MSTSIWSFKQDVTTNLIVLGRELVQTFLYYMVAVEVLNEDDDVQTECDDDRMDLAIVSVISLCSNPPCKRQRGYEQWRRTCLPPSRKEVDHLLNGTRAMHVQGDVDKIPSN